MQLSAFRWDALGCVEAPNQAWACTPTPFLRVQVHVPLIGHNCYVGKLGQYCYSSTRTHENCRNLLCLYAAAIDCEDTLDYVKFRAVIMGPA